MGWWVGPRRSRDKIICGIPTVCYDDSMKILGIYFKSHVEASMVEENWKEKIEKMEKVIKRWQNRNLSLIGKIIVAKTFLLSIWTYTLQALSLPEKVLSTIDSMIFRFLWQKKHSNKRAFEKVKRAVLCLPKDEGGLDMISCRDQQAVLLIKWLNKSKRQYEIADLFFKRYGGIERFIECNPKNDDINIEFIPSSFWCDVAKQWQYIRKKIINFSDYNIMEQTLFHNELITFKNRTLNLLRWQRSGLHYVRDVVTNGQLLSLEEIKVKTGDYASIVFDYHAVKTALANARCQYNDSDQTNNLRDSLINLLEMSNKNLRGELNHQKNIQICGASFWQRKYNIDTIRRFSEIYTATKETRLRVLQFKILHNIYPTNIVLNKMKIKSTELCETCRVKDYIDNFFIYCQKINGFWHHVSNTILHYTNKTFEMTETNILMGFVRQYKGYTQNVIAKANHILLIAKISISKMRYRNEKYCKNVFRIFDEEMFLRRARLI